MTARAYIWIPSLFLLSCQVVFDYEKLESGEQANTPDSGSSGSAGADGGSSDDPCPNLVAPSVQGTILVKLQRDDGKSCFFMDKHEVTRAQYLAFSSGTIQPQGAECAWNTAYTDPACEDASTRITKEDKQPMVCVDQCDAQKYCESVGKTLCHGNKMHASDEKYDDWYAACSNNGETSYPYGNVANANYCNLQASNPTTWDVDTGVTCKNYAGVVDLLGNVSEWVGGPEACSTAGGADDDCLTRGYSFTEQRADCGSLSTPKRSLTRDDLGFRCCAYPTE